MTYSPSSSARSPTAPTSPLFPATAAFSGCIVVDAAEHIVSFLGANSPDVLQLSLVNQRWCHVVRSHELWIPIAARVAPYSSAALLDAHSRAHAAGEYRNTRDWVGFIADTMRGRYKLVASNTADQLRVITQSQRPWSSWISALFRRAPQRQCIISGCCTTGKTTFAQQILRHASGATLATASPVFEPPVLVGNWSFLTAEVVSIKRMRPLLRHFLSQMHCFIVIVDASNPTAIDDLRDELSQWVLDASAHSPICFIVNKLDRPGSLSCEAAIARLGLGSLGDALFVPGRPPFWGWQSTGTATHVSTSRPSAVIGASLTHEARSAECVRAVLDWIDAAADLMQR